MKKILLCLFVSFISLIGFGYCKNITDIYLTNNTNGNYTYGSNDEIRVYGNSNNPFAYCINPNNSLKVYYIGLNGNVSYNTDYQTCFYIPSDLVYISIQPSQNTTINYVSIKLVDFGTYETLENNYNTCQTTLNNVTCETHIQFQDISNGVGVKTISSRFSPFSGANNNSVFYNSTENEIQISQYGDVEIISTVQCTPSNCSSCESDLSTCQSNLSSCGTSLSSCNSDLSACLSGNFGTGEYNWSALFINNIQHLGKPIINITIPEEIDWDYSGNENSFDLDVKGYAVDSDYIQGIIDINSYQVTSEDFTDIFVNGLTLIFPYIVVVLFIVFIRKLIKKIFR